MDLHLTPMPNQDFCVRQVGEETVFLAESGDQVLSLNEMGSYIWQQMDGNHTLRDILDIICHEYDVEAAQARQDLQLFVEQLLAEKLITLEDADG
ncbi:MAG: PqqD family protein [Candidatus Krumholzibacteriia bacterium]